MSVAEDMGVGPFDDPPETEPAESFCVHDVASAEWAIRRIGKLRADLADDEVYYQQHVAWITGQRQREAAAESWLVEQLESWHRQQLDVDDRRKTIRLPSGDLKARKSPDTVSIADPNEFCAAYADTELVRVRMSPDLNAVKREVLKRGASFDGVEVVEGEVKFSVVCGKPAEDEDGI